MQKCRLALFVCKSVGPGHRGKPSEKKPLPPVGGLEPGALSRQSCEQGTAGYNRAYLSTPSIYSCTVRNFCRNPIQPYCTYSRTADYYRYRYTAVPCTLAVYQGKLYIPCMYRYEATGGYCTVRYMAVPVYSSKGPRTSTVQLYLLELVVRVTRVAAFAATSDPLLL
jgi:hypothetical protein